MSIQPPAVIRVLKTVRKSYNPINMLQGKWVIQDISDSNQILINCRSSFLVTIRINRELYSQQTYSNFSYICYGPIIDDLNSFLAIRDSDLVLYFYSVKIGLFIAKSYTKLPELSINPSYVFYYNGCIFVSCYHGGFSVFKLDIDHSYAFKLISVQKPTNFALFIHQLPHGIIARIESCESLSFYSMENGELLLRISYGSQYAKFYYSFSHEHFICMFYKFPNDDSCYLLRVFDYNRQEFITEKTSQITGDINEIMVTNSIKALIFTSKPQAYQFSMKTYDIEGVLQIKEEVNKAMIVDEGYAFLNCLKANCNFYLSIGETEEIRSRAISIYSHRALVYYPQNTSFTPQAFISYSNTSVFYNVFGYRIIRGSQLELSDHPNGLMVLNTNTLSFLAISYESNTKLYKILQDSSVQEIRSELPNGFMEFGKTLGFVNFKENDALQIRSRGINFIGPTKPPFLLLDDNQSITHFSSSGSLLLIVIDKREVRVYDLDNESSRPDSHIFDNNIVSVSLSKVERNEKPEFFLIATEVSLANNSNENCNVFHFKIRKPVDFKDTMIIKCYAQDLVTTIEFLDRNTFSLGHRSGNVVVLRKNLEECFDILFTQSIGEYKVTQISIPRGIIAMSSRVYMMAYNNQNLVSINPFLMNSIAFCTQYQKGFFCIYGKVLDFIYIEPGKSEVYSTKLAIKEDDQILRIIPIEGTNYLIILKKHMLSLYDSKDHTEFCIVENAGPNEEFLYASCTRFDRERTVFYCLSKIENQYIIRDYPLNKTSPIFSYGQTNVFDFPIYRIEALKNGYVVGYTKNSIYMISTSKGKIVAKFSDQNMNIKQIDVIENELYICDLYKPLLILRFDEKLKSLYIKLREHTLKYLTSAFLSYNPNGKTKYLYVFGDKYGSIFIKDHKNISFNVGEQVSGIYVSQDSTDSIFFSTHCGTLGTVLTAKLSTYEANLLKKTEEYYSNYFSSHTKCSPSSFRRKSNSSFLFDLDLIEKSLTLSDDYLNNILKPPDTKDTLAALLTRLNSLFSKNDKK